MNKQVTEELDLIERLIKQHGLGNLSLNSFEAVYVELIRKEFSTLDLKVEMLEKENAQLKNFIFVEDLTFKYEMVCRDE